MLNDAIPLEVGNELLMRDRWLVSPLGYDGQVLQIFQQLLILGNRKHNGRSLALIVGQIL